MIVALTWGLRGLFNVTVGSGIFSPTISLGVLMVGSYLLAQLLRPLKLPLITGYMIFGILCGPYVLEFITMENVDLLRLIDEIAITLIVIFAGAEIEADTIRNNSGRFFINILIYIVITFAGVFTAVALLGDRIPFLSEVKPSLLIVAALVLAVCSVPKSPSTAIAIIDELGAKGVVSQGVLAMKVMLDVMAVFLFAIALGSLKSVLHPEVAGFDFVLLAKLLWEIVGAIVVGALLSLFVIAYLRYYNKNLILFILAMCVLSIQLCHYLSIEAVITPLTMGFCVRNFSKEGRRLVFAIGKSKTPIYVIFFAITGASLRLDFLMKNWWIALLLVLLIRGLNWSAFWIGLRLTKMPDSLKKYCHYGFIAQAGVTLGFAAIVERTFAEVGYKQMGSDLRGIIVAIVVVHQLVGPPLFYRSLIKAGEDKQQRLHAQLSAARTPIDPAPSLSP